MFPKETLKFSELFDKFFFPQQDEHHSQKLEKYGFSKCKTFSLNLINYLKRKEVSFLRDFPKGNLLEKDLVK